MSASIPIAASTDRTSTFAKSTSTGRGRALVAGALALVAACSNQATSSIDDAAPVADTPPSSDVPESSPDSTMAASVVASSTPGGGSPASESDSAPPPETLASLPPDVASQCVDELPLRRQIAQLVWPAVYAESWDEAIRTVAQFDVGGVLLMTTAGWSADDLRQHLLDLEAATDLGVLVATDEEGGDVQRLSVLGELPSQRSVSETLTPDEARSLVAHHAAALSAAGVDVVFGPVVDVAPADGDPPLQRSRFFVGTADQVAAYASAYVDGWQGAGVLPVLKHYPGHGSASGDTHVGRSLTEPLAQLEQSDLIPFAQLAGSGAAVMVGHLTVPGLTNGVPATQSSAALDYLRNELRFGDALAISDALDMDAVGLTEPDAAVSALAAGLDVAIFTNTSSTAAVIDALEAAVQRGEIDPTRIAESARRVLIQSSGGEPGCTAP